MIYTAESLGNTLCAELEKGYDVVRISRAAFQIYQDHGAELTSDLDEKLIMLMAMEEGREFELSEDELSQLALELKACKS